MDRGVGKLVNGDIVPPDSLAKHVVGNLLHSRGCLPFVRGEVEVVLAPYVVVFIIMKVRGRGDSGRRADIVEEVIRDGGRHEGGDRGDCGSGRSGG